MCSVDITKFVCSLLILGFHLIPTFGFSDIEFYYSEWLCRICVPFFFLSTGYFLKDADLNRIKKYTFKIFVYYVIATTIYLPFIINSYESAHEFIHAFIFDGAHYHLWYFPALIFGVALNYLVSKLNNKIQYIIIYIALIFGIFFNEYYKLFVNLIPNLEYIHYLLAKIGTTRNGLFFAFPMISIGRLTSHGENSGKTILNLIIFSILAFIEACFLRIYIPYVYLDLSIFGLVFAYYVFKLCLQLNINIDKKKSLFLRKTSTIIYIIHPFVISVINKLCINNIIINFLLCSLLCILLSLIYLKMVKHK